MNFSFLRRTGLLSIIGATLLWSASCVNIDEQLGKNLIPTDRLWEVYTPDAAPLNTGEVMLMTADSLSGYSSRRFTFGAINDGELGTCTKATSFTLVPVITDLDLGNVVKIRQFHFSAVRDTLSNLNDNQERMMQNVFVYGLEKALDSTIIYTNALNPGVKHKSTAKPDANPGKTNREIFLNPGVSRLITKGVPVYNGSDSLSFDFSEEYAWSVVNGIKAFRENYQQTKDTLMKEYLKNVPGIYIEAETPSGKGGRINMFNVALEFDSNGYIAGNYAELKLTTEYDGKQVDTSFVFIFGPSGFVNPSTGKIPTQYAFNGSDNSSDTEYKNGKAATADIRVEGGSGVKPVIKAEGIKRILNEELQKRGLNAKEVVINKATVIMPYDVNRQWDKLDKFPTILSPTVKLHGKDDYGETYVSYAGLTDASIESENQGDINRSLSLYSPDISHHVQEILKLDETAEDYEENLSKYDIWMLIMHEEVTVTSSSGSSYDDYYNSLLYNSYYNNMMYDPYGYGYGYGGYGYGYGGYGYDSYGYNNYYNYMMMASYMNSGSTSTESVSVDLDKDRYYDCSLGGPENANEELRPRLKLTFSAPKTAHVTE